MRETLEDIRDRLRQGDYKNEEHVRQAIVCRVLAKLGWNIWNPVEVNAEFPAMRSEDASRVDIAVFMPPQWLRPAVFVEIKAAGKLAGCISTAEIQLRDYNRNNQADISVLTDGGVWRFYLASASGEFSQKCFEALNILDGDSALDDVELAFDAFLSKEALQSGKAVEDARLCLKRTDAQKIMFEMLPKAQRDADENPALSLIECFVKRCAERGIDCTKEEALKFVQSSRARQNSPVTIVQPAISRTPSPASISGTLSLQGRYGTQASGHLLPDNKRFVVFTNSLAAALSQGSQPEKHSFARLHQDLVKKKILRAEDTKDGLRIYRLMRDYEFSSISAAASVFLGRSANGHKEWKDT